MLLRHARVVGNGDPARLIEIRDGVINAVRPDWNGLDVGAAEIFDLDGRWVMPGLWDHHVHFTQWAIARDRLDVSGAESADHAAALVGALVGALAGGAVSERRRGNEVLVGIGFRDALWPDEPTAAMLDTQAGQLPTVLISADLHAVWLNTAALRRFGYSRSSGLLREDDAFAVQLAVADLPGEQVDQLVADAAAAAAARGVVGIVDFEMPDIGADWQHRISTGMRSLRVACSVWPARLQAALERGARSGDALPGTDGLATMGPLKVIIDGSLNTRTAYCFDAYPGPPGPHPNGLLTVSADKLTQLLIAARRAGIDAAVHAIGDHANAIALDAYQRAGGDWTGHGRIEHAQLLADTDIARTASLGLVASVQPEHALDDRDVADRYWAGRTPNAFAYRSLLAAGISLALGSDAPVAPLDPWIAIAAAAHRTRDERPPWHPEQRIPVAEALRASVHSTLDVGAVADLAVLDVDPLDCSAHELRAMPVAATMLGGRWTLRPTFTS